jgi:hypothetical protein
LNRENAFGMSHVPHFTAIPLLEAGEHELRAHRTIADETTFKDRFLKKFFHNWLEWKVIAPMTSLVLG